VSIINGHKSEILKDKPFTIIPNNQGKTTNRQRYSAYLKLYNEGMCDKEIGELTGRGKKTICAWRKRMGLVSHVAPKRKPLTI
jgi:hypothetical protein